MDVLALATTTTPSRKSWSQSSWTVANAARSAVQEHSWWDAVS